MLKWNQKVKKTLIYSSGLIGVGVYLDQTKKRGNETF